MCMAGGHTLTHARWKMVTSSPSTSLGKWMLKTTGGDPTPWSPGIFF